MAKIIAHFSKKAGMPEYGSQQFSASVEAESDDDNPETIRLFLKRLFSLAKESVDEQLSAARHAKTTGNGHAAPPQTSSGYFNSGQNGRNGSAKPGANGNANGRHVPASVAQKKAVFAICKSLNLDSAQYNVDDMNVKQASQLIDQLKSQQTAR